MSLIIGSILLFNSCIYEDPFAKLPTGDLYPTCSGIKVKHTYYALDYNSEHKQANWVYYQLKERGTKVVDRKGCKFSVDPKLKTDYATPDDYRNSGYDRGHLCPAGDMAFDKQAMYETFYMSNISPQDSRFNRGIWQRLEGALRKRGQKETLYVVTGPIFKENKGKIGSGVTIPGYFYKVIYSPAKLQMMGYVIPNKESREHISNFIVSVDSVEVLTGIDFFPQLPDDIERVIEADTASHLELLLPKIEFKKASKQQQLIAVVGVTVLFLLVIILIKWSTKGEKRKEKGKRKVRGRKGKRK